MSKTRLHESELPMRSRERSVHKGHGNGSSFTGRERKDKGAEFAALAASRMQPGDDPVHSLLYHRALGELATLIAHEIRQPLSAIVTNGETSLRWMSRDDLNAEKVRNLTSRMVASARRANDIVQRILDMAADDAPRHIPVDLSDVVEEALLLVRHDLESEGIELSLLIARPSPEVLGDRIQLQQVVVNLLSNSIQAIAQVRCAKRQVSVSVEAQPETSAVTVAVRDSGPGIPDSLRDCVFQSFFTTKAGGMGVGLALCESIVVAHGGTIAASNHCEGGALFSVSLPALSDEVCAGRSAVPSAGA
ncbi:HAMP domain-containing sensor histidine kinase [Pelagibius sp. 7325]|uniref:sensor histidine kinase n=1 Tax=Pelagibius sp. 7325 TaxID=3131994 RepID=UPI0030EC8D28